MATSSIYRTWVRRIESGRLTKSQQTTFGNYLSGRGRRNNLTPDELRSLKARLDQACRSGDIRIGMDQEREGLAWLRQRIWQVPSGFIDADNFSHFELRGYHAQDVHFGGYAEHRRVRTEYRPIYRVVTFDGRYFDYTVAVHHADAMRAYGPERRPRRFQILGRGNINDEQEAA